MNFIQNSEKQIFVCEKIQDEYYFALDFLKLMLWFRLGSETNVWKLFSKFTTEKRKLALLWSPLKDTLNVNGNFKKL